MPGQAMDATGLLPGAATEAPPLRYAQQPAPYSSIPPSENTYLGDSRVAGESSIDPSYPDASYPGVPDYYDLDIRSSLQLPLRASFGPGIQFQRDDGEYRLQIHYESQIEARAWGQDEQSPANSGFFLPRQRFFFNGNIGEPIEYELAINRGLNNINLLNAFINVVFDERFVLRFGRFFTPFPYDQFAISNYWLPTPERSIYTTNLSLNRQIGVMALGSLFDKRLDYAVGAFNGSRNSFESLNYSLDGVAYLNARPFQNTGAPPWLEYLNLGTSVAFGSQDQSPAPASFRIAGGSPDANIPGIATTPFLILNPGVVERGDRLLGSIHLAYFCNSLSLIGEWQYGRADYATGAAAAAERVPFSGFYTAGGYFLTGEQIQRRTRVKPLRSLIPVAKEDERGAGAWEAVARVSQLRLGENVFTAGLADPTLWSNSATTTEVGLNWYWNEYVKMYMFWLHGQFGESVQFRPGAAQKTADMFWLRFQLYF